MADAGTQYPFDRGGLDILITCCQTQRHKPISAVQRVTWGQHNDFGGK